MPLLKARTNFEFLLYRIPALVFSVTLCIVAFVALGVRGLNLGLDFTGGVLVEVSYDQAVELQNVRDALDKAGYGEAVVQSFGTASDVLIRLPPAVVAPQAPGAAAGQPNSNSPALPAAQAGTAAAGASSQNGAGDQTENAGAELGRAVLSALRVENPNVNLRQTQFIGPQVGQDLAQQAALALLVTFILVFVYVMLRFRWKFAAGAIIALVHDVVVVMGAFAIFQWRFDLTVLAAVLAVIGYSINDTIVVFDRIRENFRAIRRGSPMEVMDVSINQTLSRTINTALTVLIVLVALLALGGDSVQGFSIALIIGTVMGTYSSIYIASAIALLLKATPADMVTAKREEVDSLP